MNGDTKEKNLPHEAIGLFMRTDRLHKKLCEKRLEEIKLHRSQHIMLMHLHRFGKTVSQKELAESLSITPAAAAVSVKKLIDGGYVERKTSDKDARYNDVSITEKGKKVVKDLEQEKRDPILDEINALKEKIAKLEKELNK